MVAVYKTPDADEVDYLNGEDAAINPKLYCLLSFWATKSKRKTFLNQSEGVKMSISCKLCTRIIPAGAPVYNNYYCECIKQFTRDKKKPVEPAPVAPVVECEHCHRKGHRAYLADGSPNCYKLRVCDRCGGNGHSRDMCLRDICETCRVDGLGHIYVGHSTENCRKNHICTKCRGQGHYEAKCLLCSSCGFRKKIVNGVVTHKCRRDQYDDCRSCGAHGQGRCPCLEYMKRT